ncbi:MAG: ABC transporter permease [Chloroflexia bacterium]|jgi:hypothetical protein
MLGAANLGIRLCTFSKSEVQAIMFIPPVILPHVFLSGPLWPVVEMPDWAGLVAPPG